MSPIQTIAEALVAQLADCCGLRLLEAHPPTKKSVFIIVGNEERN
jgi:hypothetical protein